jgi:uncharacterized C2H2 Zn-finger protein
MIAGGQIKACCVKMENIAIPANLNNEESKTCLYECYFCEKRSKTFPVLNNHMQKKHPDKTFFNCDYKACLHLFFTSEEERRTHMEEHHSSDSDGQKLFRCVYCNKLFLKNVDLLGHMQYTHQKNHS